MVIFKRRDDDDNDNVIQTHQILRHNHNSNINNRHHNLKGNVLCVQIFIITF